MGITFAIFSLCGYMPVISDWLMMIRKDSIKAGDINFSSLVEIPSCPVDVLDRSDIIVF